MRIISKWSNVNRAICKARLTVTVNVTQLVCKNYSFDSQWPGMAKKKEKILKDLHTLEASKVTMCSTLRLLHARLESWNNQHKSAHNNTDIRFSPCIAESIIGKCLLLEVSAPPY